MYLAHSGHRLLADSLPRLPIAWTVCARLYVLCCELHAQGLTAWLQRVLLMDEISTGLDSATTYSVAKFLSNTTHVMGLTTMIGLLQPPPEVYAIFDDVLLLTDGYSTCSHLLSSMPPALLCPALLFPALLRPVVTSPALPCCVFSWPAQRCLLHFTISEHWSVLRCNNASSIC